MLSSIAHEFISPFLHYLTGALASVLVDSLQELLVPAHMAVHLDNHPLAPKTMVANLRKNQVVKWP